MLSKWSYVSLAITRRYVIQTPNSSVVWGNVWSVIFSSKFDTWCSFALAKLHVISHDAERSYNFGRFNRLICRSSNFTGWILECHWVCLKRIRSGSGRLDAANFSLEASTSGWLTVNKMIYHAERKGYTGTCRKLCSEWRKNLVKMWNLIYGFRISNRVKLSTYTQRIDVSMSNKICRRWASTKF